MASNEVRIIGGMWRGRKIAFPDGPGLRPTLGRVRETVFNWLSAEVPGSHCLDLFAGSGALGLEAASRGAAAVTLVESNRRVARHLRETVIRLHADQVSVICDRAERMLARRTGSWDIVFVDPPFEGNVLARVLDQILRTRALAAGGVVYVEASRHVPLPVTGWREIRHGRAGDTQFGLLASP